MNLDGKDLLDMKKCSIQSSQGLSFVELLIAMCLIGLLVAAFLPIMTNSFLGIRSVGQMNQVIDQVQQDVENELLTPTTESGDQQILLFPSAGIEGALAVNGKLVTITSTSTAHSVTITVF